METFIKMIDLFEGIKKDTPKIYKGKNKSAYNRLRKSTVELKKLIVLFRKEIVEQHKLNIENDVK